MKITIKYENTDWTENAHIYFPKGLPSDPSVRKDIDIDPGDVIEVYAEYDGVSFSLRKANGAVVPITF